MRAVALVLALAALPAWADTSAPAAGRAASGPRRVLTAAEANDCFGSTYPKYFTPTADEVRRVEAGLAAALVGVEGAYGKRARRVRARLATDGVWLFGSNNGKRWVHVHGFCADLAKGAAGACSPSVKDGGDCVWFFDYSVEDGAFKDFRTNGDA